MYMMLSIYKAVFSFMTHATHSVHITLEGKKKSSAKIQVWLTASIIL